jgi:hypothetical protein
MDFTPIRIQMSHSLLIPEILISENHESGGCGTLSAAGY